MHLAPWHLLGGLTLRGGLLVVTVVLAGCQTALQGLWGDRPARDDGEWAFVKPAAAVTGLFRNGLFHCFCSIPETRQIEYIRPLVCAHIRI